MNKKRGLFIVIGLVLLCVLLAVYVTIKNRNEQEDTDQEETDTEEIIAISEKEIEKLTFQISGKDITFKKEEQGWKMLDDGNFPVDESKIKNLTSSLSSIKADRTLTDVQNLKDYGLEEPENKIQVEKTDGTTETIHVGSENPSTGDTYIYLNEENNTVYTVDSDLATVFSGGLYNYASGEDYPEITSSTVHEIKVEKSENPFTVYSSGDSVTGWMVTDDAGKTKEADSAAAGTLQSTVAGFTFSNYYEYDCKDWSLYGLEDPKMTLEAAYTIQETADEDEDDSEEVKEQEKSLTLYVGNLAEDGNYYVRLNDSREVHGISQNSLDGLLNGKAFNYWKTAVDHIILADLDHLDVTYEKKTYTLKKVETKEAAEADEEDEKTITTYYVDDQEADKDSFLDFYRGTLNMVCQSRLENYKDKGEPELTLHYYGTDGKEVKVTYTSRDASFYTVADQDGNYGLVNKMNVKELIEQFVTLLNGTGEEDLTDRK